MSAPHLDDDTLSAHLDDEALDVDAAAHLAGCAPCRARLEALASAAGALAEPAAPRPGLRDAAVARALRAADEPDRAVGAAARARSLRWTGAAAAAVIVLVGVTVVTRMGGDDGASTAASGADVADGGDLGELDAASIKLRVQGEVEPQAFATGDESSSLEGGGGTDDGQGLADEAAPQDAPAPNAAMRSARAGPPRTKGTAACEARVAEDYDKGLIGPLVYRATGTWQGTQAFVLTYRIAEAQGELDHMVFVVAQRGCELLNVQAF